ncbi:MAG: hypothetical protein LBT84_02170 [Spirochaetia bacterium]|jgi:hypothetical protein|nr:hypothetical protein [Spirochaetia bacterium]
MKKLYAVKFVLLAIAALAGFSALTMILWNIILPNIAGLPAIDYGQAVGLFLLSRLLFGGIGGGKLLAFGFAHKHHHYRNHLRDKWKGMSDDERKEFAQKFFHRPFNCASFDEEKK